jgi:phage gp29-like protein
MLWEIKGSGNNKAEVEFLTNYFEEIQLHNLTDNILDAVYYGYQPFVIYWDLINGKRIPRIEDRPQEYFFYDQENNFRIRSRNNPNGILAEELAFLVARYKPSYLNPYGNRIAAKVFWPIAFKKGGLKFWVTMTEKYGMPFLIGRQPRGTKKEDQTKLADMLEQMVQDAIAVINDDEKIEIVESPFKDASVNLYKELLEFCNKEISKAVLTVTNTTEIGSVGSFAASKTQREGEQDVNLSDVKLVEQTINKLIQYIHALNFGSGPAPKFILYDEESVDKVLAERDEILSRTGVKFSKKYIKKSYNLEDDDFDLTVSSVNNTDVNAITEFSSQPEILSPKKSRESIDELMTKIPSSLLQLQMEQTMKPVIDLISSAKDYSEIQKGLYKLYPEMDNSQMESLLEKSIFISELWGRANAG